MHLDTPLHHVSALERQQRLRAEAAARRLADLPSTRMRIALALSRAATRFETAHARRRAVESLTDPC
jgi:hypothetical protein